MLNVWLLMLALQIQQQQPKQQQRQQQRKQQSLQTFKYLQKLLTDFFLDLASRFACLVFRQPFVNLQALTI